jgi:hypothetical protein
MHRSREEEDSARPAVEEVVVLIGEGGKEDRQRERGFEGEEENEWELGEGDEACGISVDSQPAKGDGWRVGLTWSIRVLDELGTGNKASDDDTGISKDSAHLGETEGEICPSTAIADLSFPPSHVGHRQRPQRQALDDGSNPVNNFGQEFVLRETVPYSPARL